MSAGPQASAVTILLTGVTGFLGKVVLEELIRQRIKGTLHFDRVLVSIRSARGQTAVERFRGKVLESPCFSKLPKGWHNDVGVIAGDLMEANCGLGASSLDEITENVTHIIHCAGCVSFGSPINVLLSENVTASLNILRLAQRCTRLQRLVATSTAYVTPNTAGPIWEQLVALPRPAKQILAELMEGGKTADQVCRETGHPNNYTLVKCLAEHFIAQEKGAIPLTIVRPSIISASLQYPFPGWIDSFAALASPISAFALGGLKVLHGDPSAILDVVPVDSAAESLIKEALYPEESTADHDTALVKFVHCVSTTKHGPSTRDIVYETIAYFSKPENIVLYKPTGWYVGTDDRQFRFFEFVFQYVPVKMSEVVALLMLNWDGAAKARKTLVRLGLIDTHFRYFVKHTYDYRCAVQVLPDDFDKEAYMQTMLRGMRQNLLLPLLPRLYPKTSPSKTAVAMEEAK